MIGTLARVITGFALACLTAGLVQVLFVMTPAQLLGSPSDIVAQRAGETGLLALLAATHAAIFAALFALIAVAIGEWMGIRSLPYYLLAGMAIAALGFAAQFNSEVTGQPTILNNYALKAFLTSGFFAGLVYWLLAGRGDGLADEAGDGAATIGVPPPKSWKNRPKIMVEDTRNVREGALAKKRSLSSTLDENEAEISVKPAKAAGPQGELKPATPADPKSTAATSVPSTKPAASAENTPAKKS